MPQATAGSDHNPNMQKKPAEQDVLLLVVVVLLLVVVLLPQVPPLWARHF